MRDRNAHCRHLLVHTHTWSLALAATEWVDRNVRRKASDDVNRNENKTLRRRETNVVIITNKNDMLMIAIRIIDNEIYSECSCSIAAFVLCGKLRQNERENHLFASLMRVCVRVSRAEHSILWLFNRFLRRLDLFLPSHKMALAFHAIARTHTNALHSMAASTMNTCARVCELPGKWPLSFVTNEKKEKHATFRCYARWRSQSRLFLVWSRHRRKTNREKQNRMAFDFQSTSLELDAVVVVVKTLPRFRFEQFLRSILSVVLRCEPRRRNERRREREKECTRIYEGVQMLTRRSNAFCLLVRSGQLSHSHELLNYVCALRRRRQTSSTYGRSVSYLMLLFVHPSKSSTLSTGFARF